MMFKTDSAHGSINSCQCFVSQNHRDYEWVIWLHCAHTISSQPMLIPPDCLHLCLVCTIQSGEMLPRSLINTWFIHLYGPGLLHLQGLPEDCQQAVHIGEEWLWDDSQRRVQHHPLWRRLGCSRAAVWLCIHRWPGEQGKRCHYW